MTFFCVLFLGFESYFLLSRKAMQLVLLLMTISQTHRVRYLLLYTSALLMIIPDFDFRGVYFW